MKALEVAFSNTSSGPWTVVHAGGTDWPGTDTDGCTTSGAGIPANFAWTLASGSGGTRTVYARFKHAADEVFAQDDINFNSDSTPPIVTVPANITAEATGPGGATVTFTASANDLVDGPITPSCSPVSGSTFPIGTTTVTCSATDAHGNTGSNSFSVIVVDTTPPAVAVPGNITKEATGATGAVATFTVTASDLVDGSVAVTCSPASGATFGLGTTTVTCSATDTHGNTGSGSFSVTVVDTTSPTVTVPANITTEATGPSGAVVTFSASASDLVDGAITPSCSPASGSTFALGTTTVTCTATDAHGNLGSASFSVTVVDTTPPSVTVPAAITTEATGPSGAVVTFSASATDIVDGPVAVNCSSASGSTFALGTTTVNCSAIDAHGNTGSASFSVIVVDTTPPDLSLPANPTAEATGPSGAAVSFTATASDLVDGSVAVICSPVSGSTFALGTTTVNCSATDAHGNIASGSFTVTVVDTTPPSLSLPGNLTAEATGPSGAAVNFTATASDLVDGPVAVNCSPASGSTFALGTTTVNCSAIDAHGNIGSGSFTITIVDTTPPSLGLPSDISVFATGNSNAIVTYSASATDLVDGPVPVNCSPASGSTFPIGQTTVNCSATDAHGNMATGSFHVNVSYNWSGFFQPIDNLPVLNRVKAGSAIPVKFSLGGNQGLNIFAAGYPVSTVTACGTTTTDDVEATVTAGGSSLTYDALANQYIYVWKTDKLWAGTCRTLTVKLADGSIHQANFTFTK
jgi:predicted metallo-beta-lactamase superfamily hydrolase